MDGKGKRYFSSRKFSFDIDFAASLRAKKSVEVFLKKENFLSLELKYDQKFFVKNSAASLQDLLQNLKSQNKKLPDYYLLLLPREVEDDVGSGGGSGNIYVVAAEVSWFLIFGLDHKNLKYSDPKIFSKPLYQNLEQQQKSNFNPDPSLEIHNSSYSLNLIILHYEGGSVNEVNRGGVKIMNNFNFSDPSSNRCALRSSLRGRIIRPNVFRVSNDGSGFKITSVGGLGLKKTACNFAFDLLLINQKTNQLIAFASASNQKDFDEYLDWKKFDSLGNFSAQEKDKMRENCLRFFDESVEKNCAKLG